jgi:hypothetical protein
VISNYRALHEVPHAQRGNNLLNLPANRTGTINDQIEVSGRGTNKAQSSRPDGLFVLPAAGASTYTRS